MSLRQFSNGLVVLAAGLAVATAVKSAVAAEAEAADEAGLGEVIVTGSRIRTTGMEMPTPVTVLSQDALSDLSPGNFSQAVVKMPQFYNSSQPVTAGPAGGALSATTVNLRGLGNNRTLTLLNGRRMVPFNSLGTVDIGSFPMALTQRMDVVTGGASAAYGTDAVAGVVNVILDTGFEGIDVRGQVGISDRGDNLNEAVSVAFGHGITDRWHVLGSLDYNNLDEVGSYKDREWFRSWGLINQQDVPLQLLLRPDVVSTQYTCGGLILAPGSALNRLEFLPDGSTRPFRTSTLGAVAGGQGAQSVAPEYGGGSGCDPRADPNRAGAQSVVPGTHHLSGFLYTDYDVNDNLTVFVQGLYSNSYFASNGNGTIMQGSTVGTIYSGNAYLPASVQQIMDQEGRASFQLARYNLDIAGGRILQTNDTISFTTGFDLTVPGDGYFSDWKVNGYYQYGRNNNDITIRNYTRQDHLYQQLDAVRDPAGNIVCNATLMGNPRYADCVPINLFGLGNASPEAAAYSMGPDRTQRSHVVEHDFELALSGKLFEGWAGPVDFALGADYRGLAMSQSVRPEGILELTLPANDPSVGVRGIPTISTVLTAAQVYQNGGITNTPGAYSVREAFAELNVPLLRGVTGFQTLDLNLATRVADYSGSGEIWAYKGGLSWTIYDDLRLRGTVSRDVRAATLQERFNEAGAGGGVRDPLLNNEAYTPSILTGGNPNVNPEEADTYTIGAVYQPSYLPGFSASLDWYSIEINDAIGQLSAQEIVDRCGVAQVGATCQFITRDANTNRITAIRSTYINIDSLAVSGLDLELDYQRPVTWLGGDESIDLRVFGSYLEERSRGLGGQIDDMVGDIGSGYPRYRGQVIFSYTHGNLRTYLREQYLDSGIRNRGYVLGNVNNSNGTTIDDNHVPAVFYTDLHFNYTVPSDKGQIEIYFNIDNLFDKAPPPVPSFSQMLGTGHSNSGLYDQLGRRYVLGAHVVF
ncbi:MAG: TonB-dependent receptor [Nevskiaceae bacterium]|jgi:outer membrane receptor protein involved in Fe transport|nr:TonB-dependent receptor [Nevskiaceae bacterium]